MHRAADVPLLRTAGWKPRRTRRRSTSFSSNFEDSGFQFKDLLIALVQSPEFLRRWDNNRAHRTTVSQEVVMQLSRRKFLQGSQRDRRRWCTSDCRRWRRCSTRTAPPTPPKIGKAAAIETRFLLWFNGNGIPERYWIPARDRHRLRADAVPRAARVRCATTSTCSAASTTSRRRLNGQGNGHFSALCGLMTGTAYTGRGAAGPSIDQMLAAKIGTKSRFRSLQIGVARNRTARTCTAT